MTSSRVRESQEKAETALQQGVMPGFGLPRLFLKLIFSQLQFGCLVVVTPDGDRIVHNTGRPGPEGVMVLQRWRTLRRLVLGGDVGFAESYMDGDWSSPDIASLVELAACNDDTLGDTVSGSLPSRIINRLRHALRANTKSGSRSNIMSHYDLGNAFYEQWLDKSMSYSSGVYTDHTQTLEDAQAAKQDLIIDKLNLHGGERILEIGCGWGGLAERLIQRGCHVTGLTLSPAQLDHAQKRLALAGLADRADLRLQDYRDATGTFDRIVSVEMIEAVGASYWPTYFATLRDRLVPHGTAVLQAITIDDKRFASYKRSPDFIQRYIFPGGMLPSASILREQVAAAGLALASMVTVGQSYAHTLAEWNRRFQAAWPKIQPLGFDLVFKRMWEYYLSYCEGGFRSGATDVGIYALKRGI